MDFETTIFFLFLIILLLWEIKAEFLTIIVSLALYFFLLFYLFISDIELRLFQIFSFLFINPFGVWILIALVAFYIILVIFRKRRKKMKD